MRRTSFAVVIVTLASSWASAQFVQQGDKLVGAGAAGRSRQGTSVAVSADGNTALVGGPEDGSGAGAVWVFTRSAGVWTQQGEKLVGAGAVGGTANVGSSVALSADGNTAIVGGPGDNGLIGAAWVFTRSAGVWTQQGEKLLGTGSAGAPNQGSSVALSADGNVAIVGGPSDATSTGAAWVFTRSGGVWTQQGEKLAGTGAAGYAKQGSAVALSDDGVTALVGGPADADSNGAAWVFTRSAGAWTQQGAKLIGAGAAEDGAKFGASVAVSADGNTAIVGGPGQLGVEAIGAAWVFTRSGGTWTQQGEKLVGTGALNFPSVRQGTSVDLSGDGNTAIVGGPSDAITAGAVWAFTRAGGVWTQLGKKLVGTGVTQYLAGQGSSVALSTDGSTAIVGGPIDEGGEAWVFVRDGSTNVLWVPVVAHTDGKNGSQWRSDVGLLNLGTGTANVTLTFHGPDGLVSNTTYVPAGAQSVLVDVVGQLGARDQGALEVASDRTLKVTSRTYNQAAADIAYGAGGTTGQSYPVLTAGDGLSEGQTAWLPHLTENTAYRTNIGVVNVSAAEATAKVELYDGAGSLLTTYVVTLAPGQWSQKTKPFTSMAGQTALDRGYAKVTVTSGAGVVAFASVVDNLTNDPTTITMQR